jgi:hypothetical protein
VLAMLIKQGRRFSRHPATRGLRPECFLRDTCISRPMYRSETLTAVAGPAQVLGLVATALNPARLALEARPATAVPLGPERAG